ncbi:MAG: PQQ-dependent sugar dehydrogenase [Caldilineaceae bacterium]|nr:PQQ-dependent sugar dehydrogenase [Caldilineaceae bacterium]
MLTTAQVADYVSGLSFPVQLTHAGDGSGRQFVVEREGRIRIVKGGGLVEAPFLENPQRVLSAVYFEQWLPNIAFPPSYTNTKQFYVSYTGLSGNTVISRFAKSADLDIADPDSEVVLLTLKQNKIFHNGGTPKFGPRDGYLYIASGDGEETGSQDLPRHARNPGTLLGKFLRIDVESCVTPYAIPTDNPFVSRPGSAPEIWAMGLQNSWGLAFDRQTGDLYIPDTGWQTNEKVNFQPADSGGGEDYGWPLVEGVVPPKEEGNDGGLIMPVAVYDRTQGCAVVGGTVQNGQFIYADFCSGKILSLQRQGSGKWQSKFLMTIGVPVSGVSADEAGNLYAVGYVDGKIYPLVIPTDAE